MTSPKLSHDTPRGRMYSIEPGGKPVYPSITNVAGMRAKDHLQGWYATMASKRALEMFDYLQRNPERASEEIRRVTSAKWGTQKKIAAAAEDYTRRAADFGTFVHALCEDWERSGVRPGREEMSALAAQLRQEAGALAQERSLEDLVSRAQLRLDGFAAFLDDFQPEFIEVEQTVVNHTVGYAGTTDAIVKIGGSLLSADIKTSKKVRGDYALQGVAVVNAEALLDDDGTVRPMPELVGAFIIHLPEAGGYSAVPLRTGDAEFEVFRALKQAWLFEAEECISGPSTNPQQLLLSLLRAKGGLDALGTGA
ncbi:PD-(D/E)XK nuclease family protein [Brachybacterium hainanense]|uniref:PD-(D/E)XK nuclease family protein n=1 Tax=Brachybacterium hainanense TaxID=1541174 RepID=A0ABV6RB79_9MICO